jgi:hypothetical protein
MKEKEKLIEEKKKNLEKKKLLEEKKNLVDLKKFIKKNLNGNEKIELITNVPIYEIDLDESILKFNYFFLIKN